jgi:hypothetical protein
VSQPNVFALKNSGLEPFLFAEVGTELNGSGLTVLSVLARLGFDPWAEAARLVNLPKKAMIDSLTDDISRMPLGRQSLVEAHATAARLILLLPLQNTTVPRQAEIAMQGLAAMPKWLPMTLLYCALAFGIGINMMLTPSATTPTTTAAPATTGQTVQQGQ